MKHSVLFRSLALALCLCLLLALCACAEKAAPETPGKAEPLPEAKPGEGLVNEDNPADPVSPALPAEVGAAEERSGAKDYRYGGSSDKDSGVEPSPAPVADGGAFLGEGGAGEAGTPVGGEDEPIIIDDPTPPDLPGFDPGQALVLTAAEWNDLQNWPFFTNLVNTGKISFPSFGLDPRNRIEVRVTGGAGELVRLLDADGALLWTARTDKSGTAYLFWAEGQSPDKVVCGEAEAPVQAAEPSDDPQAKTVMKPQQSVSLDITPSAPAQEGLQVMFIVDTTGSMMDEIAYLQKDFSAIAGRIGGEGVRWAVSFYRDHGDEYVTRHSPFSSDVAAIQAKLNAEYADGGGDEPEAVAEVLTECLTERTDWDEGCVKLAFLIFDAPPHDGKEEALLAAAKAAAEKGIHVIPVVASNAARQTELFGRALAILTNGTYVFLTDDSGVGGSHLEPIVGSYTVELLQDLIVRIIEDYRP